MKIGADKFVSQEDATQSELIKHTIGLVKLEDFQRIRDTLAKRQQEDLEKEIEERKNKKSLKKRKKDLTKKNKLSFELEEEEKEETADDDIQTHIIEEQGPDIDDSNSGFLSFFFKLFYFISMVLVIPMMSLQVNVIHTLKAAVGGSLQI